MRGRKGIVKERRDRENYRGNDKFKGKEKLRDKKSNNKEKCFSHNAHANEYKHSYLFILPIGCEKLNTTSFFGC